MAYGAFGGRLDHTQKNLSTLFSLGSKDSVHKLNLDKACVYFMNKSSMAFRVPKGTTKITFSENFEFRQGVGIIPSQETRVRTKGMKWDLGKAPWDKISMDTHISSSNERLG